MGDYQATLTAKADFPETQLVIGGTALAQRNLQMAERAFSEAVAMDPQLADGWFILARLQLARRDVAAAEQTLERAVRATPDDAVEPGRLCEWFVRGLALGSQSPPRPLTNSEGQAADLLDRLEGSDALRRRDRPSGSWCFSRRPRS